MALTVGEAIELDGVRELLLDAGRAGLDREIQHVTVVEVAEDAMWKGKEFLITAFANCRESVDRQLELINAAARRRCAALALPLFRIPNHVPYVDIIFPIYREIVNRQARELSYALDAHDRMSGLVLSGGQLSELAILMASLLDSPVLVLDRWQTPLVAAEPAGEMPVQAFVAQMASNEAEVLDLGAKPEPSRSAGRNVLTLAEGNGCSVFARYPIRAGRTKYGEVAVWLRDGSFTHLHLMALEQACTVLAFYMERARVIEETRAHLQRDLLDEIAMGADPDYIEAQLAARGWMCGASGVVMVVRPERQGGAVAPGTHEVEGISDDDHHAISSVVDSFRAGHIVIRRGDSVVVLAHGRCQPASKVRAISRRLAEDLVQSFASRKSGLSIGIGAPFASAGDLRRSYDEATNALNIGKRVSPKQSIFDIDDLAGYYYLSRAADSSDFAEFTSRVLGPLIRYDETHGTVLVQTLRFYLACSGNVTETARRLYVHRNTLLRRLERIRQIMGYDPFDDVHRLNLQLAFAVRALHE